MIPATALSPGMVVFHSRLGRSGTVRTKKGAPGYPSITKDGSGVYVDVDGKPYEWKLASIGVRVDTAAVAPTVKHPGDVVDSHGMGFDLRGITEPMDGPGN